MQNETPLPLAAEIVNRLGGPLKVGGITHLTPGAICKWKVPKSRGGTGGLIPSRHHAPLLAYARAHNIPLTADELIHGPAGEEAA